MLPWLLVTSCRLSSEDFVEVASQYTLQFLLELRLQACQDAVSVVGCCAVNSKIEAFIAAVAALHRLMHR